MKLCLLTYAQDPTLSATAIGEHHQSSLAAASTFNPTSLVVMPNAPATKPSKMFNPTSLVVTPNAPATKPSKMGVGDGVKNATNSLTFPSKNQQVGSSKRPNPPATEPTSAPSNDAPSQQPTMQNLKDEDDEFEDDEVPVENSDGIVVYDPADSHR